MKDRPVNIDLGHIVREEWPSVLHLMQGEVPWVSIDTPHACLLMDSREGSAVVRGTNPLSIDEDRPTDSRILRVYPESSVIALSLNDDHHPYNNGGRFYLYWRVIQPTMGIRYDIPDTDGVPVHLISGTSDECTISVDVYAGCPYVEFLERLKRVMKSISSKLWEPMIEHMDEDRIFDPDSIRVYICPIGLSSDNMFLMKALCAGEGHLLDYVLHRVEAHEWYPFQPIMDIFPEAFAFRLLVTLGEATPRPWDQFYGVFQGHLRRHVERWNGVSINAAQILMMLPRVLRLKVDEVEHFYEEEINARRGYLLDKRDLPPIGIPGDLDEEGMSVLCGGAVHIIRRAQKLCRDDILW
jgi:hypothetical protein